MNALHHFAKVVADFLAFVESPTASPETDLIYTVRHLKTLLAGIEPLFELPTDTEPDQEWCSAEQKKAVASRFSHLPVQFYRVVFDPCPVESKEEPVGGWISDDLMDIYGDLWVGHQLYQKGHPETACWEWTHLYGMHWAWHATSALYALDAYRRDNFLFRPESV